MGFLGGVDDFFKEQGERFGDLLPDLLHEASNFACQLYKNKPGVIYDMNPFNKGLWEKMCEPRPPGLPAPPPLPGFSGGQCQCVRYGVGVVNNISTGAGEVVTVWGEIGGVRITLIKRPDNLYSASYEIKCRGIWGVHDCGNFDWYQYRFSPYLPDAENVSNRIDSVTRSGGQPDNCGDPPRPPVPPYVAPEPERSTNITYTFKDGVDVNVPIVLIFPTLNNTFELKPSLTINAKIGGGDRTINFHLYPDGWYSEPGHPAEPPVSDPKIDYFINPPNPDADPLLEPSEPSPPASFAGDEDIPRARWLRVVLTKFPDKAQYGVNTPNVYFAGWMEFLKGGDCFERRQINFERSLFRFPDGADGFYVQFTNGAQGYYVTYTEVSNA